MLSIANNVMAMVYVQNYISKALTFLLTTIVLLSSTTYSIYSGNVNLLKSTTFVSEKFELTPRKVAEKIFVDIEFPRGHIGVKSFDVELVDEEGNFVPLYETYLHHWFAIKYVETNISHNSKDHKHHSADVISQRNAGACGSSILAHHWGLGSESRGTSSKLPYPFAIKLGNPTSIPPGYEEKWLFNLMVIDTRGANDKKDCSECRCELFNFSNDVYNKTRDIRGEPLTLDYKEGIFCCQDDFQRKLENGFTSPIGKFSLRYKITWIDWDEFQVPVKFYILDSTHRVTRTSSTTIHECQAKYTIPLINDGSKYHVQKDSIPIEGGGYLIYCTARMHSCVVNVTLYGQDGRTLCTSIPTYRTGKEPGNEEGYAAGMSVNYPEPGSINIKDGEPLTIESKYESGFRTGAMEHMYIYLAEKLSQETIAPQPESGGSAFSDCDISFLIFLLRSMFFCYFILPM